MKNKKEILDALYIELVKLQKEIIAADLKIIIVLEGRDAAGKDGAIKTITKHLSPREVRVVALGKPSDREQREWYFQRYAAQLAVAGEMVLFNRSWYNRAGVEHVMQFCSEAEYQSFFGEAALFEEMLSKAGFIILKYYLDIGKKEQAKRLEDRRENPLKQWKISPIDKDALQLFDDYSEARNVMLRKTDFAFAPWTIIDANDKKPARLALIIDLLKRIDYPGKDEKLLALDTGLSYRVDEKMGERLHG
ncbi:MAG: polyphosphate kinase 2 [Chitinophagaceae bacterium]|nr:MAG: polyphosphate kinase 2 [Chitinophagaceae bacterium]